MGHLADVGVSSNVRFAPILLQKSFWGDARNFSGPSMRFAGGDMRDHIVSHKNDHGASYWRYGILRWRSWLKINICEIFGVVRFSTFATKSVLFGLHAMSDLSPESAPKRTSANASEFMGSRPD